MRALRILGRVARLAITAVMVLAVVGLAALFLGPRVVGLQPLIILTGSMEPALPTGGLAYMRPLAAPASLEAPPAVDPHWQPTSAIRAGDIITFRVPRDPRVTISHRVTAVVEDESGRRFTTKGDASPQPDVQPVSAGNVVGTVVFAIPHLGRIADWLRRGEAFVAIVGVPTAVVVVGESVKVVRGIRRDRASMANDARAASGEPVHA